MLYKTEFEKMKTELEVCFPGKCWCSGMCGPVLFTCWLGSGRDALKEMCYATPPTCAMGNESDRNQVRMGLRKVV